MCDGSGSSLSRRLSRGLQLLASYTYAKSIDNASGQADLVRAEFFNLLNHVNFANPISNFNAVPISSINQNTGQIIDNAGDFGLITETSNNPRLIQFALKFNF
jgi:hypothetical protein